MYILLVRAIDSITIQGLLNNLLLTFTLSYIIYSLFSLSILFIWQENLLPNIYLISTSNFIICYLFY
jgi:hypothetical protein